MKKLLAAVAVALCATLSTSPPAAAQGYPGNTLVIVVVSGTATPGSTVVIVVTNCQVGETVTVALDGTTVAVAACTGGGGAAALPMQAAGGSAEASFTAPTTPGTYTITATGNLSGLVGTYTLTVLQDAATTTTAPAAAGTLPSTGSNDTPLLWIAGSSVAVGAALVGVAVKRRRPAAAA